MNCPYCNKEIYGMTGLQELQKFQKHMNTCRKAPTRRSVVTDDGEIKEVNKPVSLNQALDIRAESGQQMKEIAEMYPKFWEDVSISLMGELEADYQNKRYGNVDISRNSAYHCYLDFKCMFGYLVLEYFPKHGIKIGCYTDGSFAVREGNDWVHDEDGYVIGFQSPQQVITKAAEIRERQLEGK